MKKMIRLTESDLHRIVKESVNRILNEYTNGFTEKMYTNLSSKDNDTPATIARKRGARDYLAKRYKRENNLTDDQVDAVANGDWRSLSDANLPGTFLKRYDKNTGPARSMTYNLRSRRPKVEQPTPAHEEELPKKKKGFLGRFR